MTFSDVLRLVIDLGFLETELAQLSTGLTVDGSEILD